MSKINFIFSILFSFFLISCDDSKINRTDFFEIDKKEYLDKLEGFWLGQSIANWTGLITEMDKIGNIGQIKTGKFYTRHNWGGKDETNIWSSETSNNEINFVFREKVKYGVLMMTLTLNTCTKSCCFKVIKLY